MPLAPAWKRDESYVPFAAAWRAVKPDAIDGDFARNHKYWLQLDGCARILAVENLLERVRLGLETSSRLKYWLTEDYTRAVVEPNARQDKNQRRRDNVNQLAKALRKTKL